MWSLFDTPAGTSSAMSWGGKGACGLDCLGLRRPTCLANGRGTPDIIILNLWENVSVGFEGLENDLVDKRQ